MYSCIQLFKDVAWGTVNGPIKKINMYKLISLNMSNQSENQVLCLKA